MDLQMYLVPTDMFSYSELHAPTAQRTGKGIRLHKTYIGEVYIKFQIISNIDISNIY